MNTASAGSPSAISPLLASAINRKPPRGTTADGWTGIDNLEQMDPFLVTLSSEDDHWMFISSNGGLTAGRENPDQSLFPYQTEDKLVRSAHAIGPTTLVRWQNADGNTRFWQPLHPHTTEGTRSLHKKLDNTRLAFLEQHPAEPWAFSATWGFSRRFGFIRRATLHNADASPVSFDVLDGLCGINPAGLSEAFQNQFSILGYAYTRCELLPDTSLRLIYLNSAPTDRAEPSESLHANVVWSAGRQPVARLLTADAADRFRQHSPLQDQLESRGRVACPLNAYRFTLAPGESATWYWVADVNRSTAAVVNLQRFLRQTPAGDLPAILEEEWEQNSLNLQRKIAAADGLQQSADQRRNARHFSNALFNCQRGGVFPDGYRIPVRSLKAHLHTFNHEVARQHVRWLDALPETIDQPKLMESAAATGDARLHRLCMEFLPLTFSRRHGDPSRPWNRFHIRVRDRHGNSILSYQGNWRDIFQNWEALLYSFPEYAESFVARFLNSSTADGYNPYRLTSEGFDWERLDPDEPWSNIGYWGDHQIIYLMRLLLGSLNLHRDRLTRLLHEPLFTYACVPYRIKPFPDVVADPRQSITFDEDAEAEIHRRVKEIGNDGKLLPGRDGNPLMVTMAEKLLVPLLAKLSNFVPEGGIWMNTQRPEWNDANNALAGYGLSVVTMAYCYRYLSFLEEWWRELPDEATFSLSTEVAALLRQITAVFTAAPEAFDEAARRSFSRKLFAAADSFRQPLYQQGLAGTMESVMVSDVIRMLTAAREVLGRSLAANQRPDGLFHSYNLLHTGEEAFSISYLQPMLEGQVAILSAGFLRPREVDQLLTALRASPLYREDQDSYLLYPDRELPGFLDKNSLPAETLAQSPLLRALADDPEQDLIERDSSGAAHFGPELRNAADLRAALQQLPESYREQVLAHGEEACRVFEDLFQHHAFTGRSGTFFAYEGLGSIYWHMVSKLLLAVQENALEARDSGSSAFPSLQGHYQQILAGLGIHKSPREYGAFPSDAYSHTPRHAGARQPGMTGQVKEDLLIRMGELGLRAEKGCLRFDPVLLDRSEFLCEPFLFRYFNLAGKAVELEVPATSIAFTFCQLPVVYTHGTAEAAITVRFTDGSKEEFAGKVLPHGLSQRVFQRDPHLHSLWLAIPD